MIPLLDALVSILKERQVQIIVFLEKKSCNEQMEPSGARKPFSTIYAETDSVLCAHSLATVTQPDLNRICSAGLLRILNIFQTVPKYVLVSLMHHLWLIKKLSF